MDRKLKVISALIGVLLLGACRHAEDVPASVGDEHCDQACAVVIDYEGHPLHCVSWLGGHNEIGLTCDFVRYHQEVLPA